MLVHIAMFAAVQFDFQEAIKRLLRYVLEGLAVGIAASLVAKKKMAGEEILLVALTAAAALSLLDVFSPTIASGARTGAGYGIGLSTVGVNGLPLPA